MRALAIGLLALCLGGCVTDIGSALWLIQALTTQIAVPAADSAASYQPGSPNQAPPVVVWPPAEPRTGSTRGSWTGVCDPVCPKAPEAVR